MDLEPEPAVWENISAELSAVSHGNSSSRLLWMKAASVAALFIFIPFLLSDIENTETEIVPSTQVQLASSTPSYSNSTNPNSVISETPQLLEPIVNPAGTFHDVRMEPQFASPSIQPLGERLTPELTQAAPKTSPAPLDEDVHLVTLPLNEPTKYQRDLNFDNPTGKPERGLWSIGASVHFKHSSMMNAVSRQGMNKGSNITNIYSINYVYNLSVMRQLKKGVQLEVKLLFNNKESQFYQDFVGASYIKKSLTLNYQTFQLSYAHPIIKMGRSKIEANAGIFGSYMISIEEEWAGESRNVLTDGFKKGNVGLNLGLDGVFPIGRSFDIHIGAYYSNGIMNIFTGTEHIPSHFLKTYTSSFGTDFGLRYHL
ncbi:MAG: hypothetical protein HRT57_04595 [Crocinitomicaceae bacterium]|nr:hypothetical protein [Crocinitomicaceae bacterium]